MSSKKHPKILRKSIQVIQTCRLNGPKSRSGGVWAALGRIWGWSWPVLGRLLAPRHLLAASCPSLGQLLGDCQGVWVASWAPFGPSWAASSRVLERLGGILLEYSRQDRANYLACKSFIKSFGMQIIWHAKTTSFLVYYIFNEFLRFWQLQRKLDLGPESEIFLETS